MELPQLGEQCCQEGCNQLDFLPLKCECGKQFCSDHFTQHTLTCDISSSRDTSNLNRIQHMLACSWGDCHEKSLVPLICEKCGKHFCVKHRHVAICPYEDLSALVVQKERHAAHKKQAEDMRVVVNTQIENRIIEAKKKPKVAQMANKVQLMRIKNKATGVKTIPSTDRLYFNIHIGQGNTGRTVPMFVSKLWTLGRAVDAVAAECKLQNNNNQSGARKLRLFKKDDGRIISRDMALIMSSLLDNSIIIDGESLIIDYINELCEQTQ